MREITVEEVKQAVQDRGARPWKLRSCSICQVPLFYLFEAGGVYRDSSCFCTSFEGELKEESWEAMAAMFNTQTPEVRERMWGEFTRRVT